MQRPYSFRWQDTFPVSYGGPNLPIYLKKIVIIVERSDGIRRLFGGR